MYISFKWKICKKKAFSHNLCGLLGGFWFRIIDLCFIINSSSRLFPAALSVANAAFSRKLNSLCQRRKSDSFLVQMLLYISCCLSVLRHWLYCSFVDSLRFQLLWSVYFSFFGSVLFSFLWKRLLQLFGTSNPLLWKRLFRLKLQLRV